MAYTKKDVANIFSNNGEIFVRYGYPFAKLSDWQRLIKLDDNFSYLVVNSTSENDTRQN